MGQIISCECTKCNCDKKFETIETEELFNLMSHGGGLDKEFHNPLYKEKLQDIVEDLDLSKYIL